MTGGTPQGSPLSPALFTVYMSSIVWEAERRMKQRSQMKLRVEKNWKGKQGKHLGVIMGDQRRHQKYRTQKAKAAWEMVRRLSRLTALGKRKIVTQQILPILTYGCELYPEPSEQQRRLASEIQRWVIGAYRGSSGSRVEELTGIAEIGRLMLCRRIRWAASVPAGLSSSTWASQYYGVPPRRVTTPLSCMTISLPLLQVLGLCWR